MKVRAIDEEDVRGRCLAWLERCSRRRHVCRCSKFLSTVVRSRRTCTCRVRDARGSATCLGRRHRCSSSSCRNRCACPAAIRLPGNTHASRIQEAFEQCRAHSPQRAAARRITIHQVSLLSRRTPPAHRCPRRRRQRQRVTEWTAMAPWNGPKYEKNTFKCFFFILRNPRFYSNYWRRTCVRSWL